MHRRGNRRGIAITIRRVRPLVKGLPVILSGIGKKRRAQLPQIAHAVDIVGFLARLVQRRQQEGDEYRDDGDHHQQFHKSKPGGSSVAMKHIKPYGQGTLTCTPFCV